MATRTDRPAAHQDPVLQACPTCGRWTKGERCVRHPDAQPVSLFGPDATPRWRDAVLRVARVHVWTGLSGGFAMFVMMHGGLMAWDLLRTGTGAGAVDVWPLAVALALAVGGTWLAHRRVSRLRDDPSIPAMMHRTVSELARDVVLSSVMMGAFGLIAGMSGLLHDPRPLDSGWALRVLLMALPWTAGGVVATWFLGPARALKRAGVDA